MTPADTAALGALPPTTALSSQCFHFPVSSGDDLVVHLTPQRHAEGNLGFVRRMNVGAASPSFTTGFKLAHSQPPGAASGETTRPWSSSKISSHERRLDQVRREQVFSQLSREQAGPGQETAGIHSRVQPAVFLPPQQRHHNQEGPYSLAPRAGLHEMRGSQSTGQSLPS